jgi:hypothetical protein
MKGTWKLMAHEKTNCQSVFMSQTNPKFTLTFTNTYLIKVREEDANKAYQYFWDPLQGYLTERTMRSGKKLSVEVLEEVDGENKKPKKHLERVNNELRVKVDDLIKKVQALQSVCQKQEEDLDNLVWESRRDSPLSMSHHYPNNGTPMSLQNTTHLPQGHSPYTPPHLVPSTWTMGFTPPRPFGSAPPHQPMRQYNSHFSPPGPTRRPPPLIYDKAPPHEFGPYAPQFSRPSQNPSGHLPPHPHKHMRPPDHRYPPNSVRWAQPPARPFNRRDGPPLHPPVREGNDRQVPYGSPMYRTPPHSGNPPSASFPVNNFSKMHVREGPPTRVPNADVGPMTSNQQHVCDESRSVDYSNNKRNLPNASGSRQRYGEEEKNPNHALHEQEPIGNENMNSRPASHR